ncbi:serine protease [Limnoraphis robusta Tam1]|uniref:Serine protease n=1 Tax=Limnoraphis robusta CCNP1315 TaxID=3110306 RepID=A0ABU5U628_9CYAN|nr:serine protease [Limnoraphis robusta]MEA5498374.1 serine protease [Limnoraphis robusta BA-68 BA1]MEA5521593.1 serine protease [Limnoraphis robusta CCNP1315]MEA5540400.1 serine protease [Limnoraphis robusta Tam1]MEA5544202.1 serine protease [Limnoraphis robusta CCNP1324]
MASALELAVVRVFKSGGDIAGSGFLVSPHYILTCAHVVAFTTERISSKQEEKPTQIIEIDFPVLEIGKKLKTEIAFWFPLKSDENIQDIAVLKLLNPDQLPERSEPINLILTRNESLWGHRFRALGFPEKGSNGEWATGELRGGVGKGRIQVEDTKETGIRLEKGFSGTAIWDEQLQGVVGMAVTQDYERPEAKVAFITPTDLLLQVGDLKKVCQVNERIQKAIAPILSVLVVEHQNKFIFFTILQIQIKLCLTQLKIGKNELSPVLT